MEINKIKKRGFTIPELLTSLAVFSMIVSAASGLFISAIRAQRKSLASQELLNQTSYILEYMGRSIRMAKIDEMGTCVVPAALNYEITDPPQGIRFMNSNDICQWFYLSNYQLWEEKGGGAPSELSSDKLRIEEFNIFARGNPKNDNQQVRVTLFLYIKGVGEKPEQQPEIKIQTTISKRNLDLD